MKEKKWKFRLYFAWQDEKEALWLGEMHRDGWRFDKFLAGLYLFSRTEPEDMVYQLDFFFDRKNNREEYLGLFRDAGWEHAGEYCAWNYFRKPGAEGRTGRIYTDREGLIEKHRKVLLFLLLTGLPSVYYATVWPASVADHAGGPGWNLLRILLAAAAGLIAFSVFRTWLCILKLKSPEREFRDSP